MVVYATLQQIGIDIAKLDTKGISPVVLTFGNSNFAGGMLSVLFAYHFIYVVIKKKLLPKQISLVIALAVSSTFPAAVQGYLIILFAIVVGISFLIARKFKSPWVNPALTLGWVVGILMVVLGLFGKFLLAGIFTRASFQARIEYWTISLKVMRDNLLFGVGPDKLYDVTSLYMSPGSLKIITTTRMDNAHNFYLNLGANYGLISMVFLLVLLVYVFLACFRNFKNLTTGNAVTVAASIAFIAMFIDGLVSLEQPGLGIWLYLLAGMAVATSKSSLDSSNLHTDVTPHENSKKSFTVKLIAGIAMSALALSVMTIGNRVVFDGKLRKDIQTVLLNQGTKETLESIESSAVRLASEPEYIVQALRPLAEIGDARKLDAISEASYDYYPLSIQASLIRADVLRALNREMDSCPLRSTLINNTPWESEQVVKYLVCIINGYSDPNLVRYLTKASLYFSEIDRTTIPANASEPEVTSRRLSVASSYARALFIIGNTRSAVSLQSYSNVLLSRLVELTQSNPALASERDIEVFRKLLRF
jgi:hypothetical protein